MQTRKNGLNIKKVIWFRRNLETEWMKVFCTPLFSPSQYLSIVFSSLQSIISGWCIRSLHMSLGVFAHLWERYLLNSMVTVWQLVSKYSQVVRCVMGACEVPSSCFYTNVCLLKISLIPFDISLAFLLALLLIKLLQENVLMWLWKLKKESNWYCIVHNLENRTLVEDDSSEQVTLR